MQSEAQVDMALVRAACGCADHILKHYFKAETPPEPASLDAASDFDLATARLAADLHARAGPMETVALAALFEGLDVDWTTMRPSQAHEAIGCALRDSSKHLVPISGALSATVAASCAGVFAASRNDMRRFQGINLCEGPSALDERMMQFMRHSETLFVRDRYGTRVRALGVRARKAVADALAQGLGRGAIRDLLAETAVKVLTQPASYWQVVAGAFVGRGRSYAQMNGYAEAGIKRYRVVAVMDKRTSSVCRRMHGKVLNVQDGIDVFLRAEAAKDRTAIVSLNPWPRRGATHTDADLTFPPYHALCRTGTVCDA